MAIKVQVLALRYPGKKLYALCLKKATPNICKGWLLRQIQAGEACI